MLFLDLGAIYTSFLGANLVMFRFLSAYGLFHNNKVTKTKKKQRKKKGENDRYREMGIEKHTQ